MESALGKLIRFTNEKNLELIGILFQADDSLTDTIVIHVHGNFGNFYTNKFIWFMSKIYTANNVAFLSFNLSAHDGLCEGYRLGVLDYIGGGVADYNESMLDIKAAVAYARSLGYKNIVLQGHSLGCDKIIDFVLNNPQSSDFVVLLSPVDSYAVQKRWLEIHKAETIPEQIQRLKGSSPWQKDSLDWLPMDEYGAEGLHSDWIYTIPITREALLSILEGSAFQYLNQEKGREFFIEIPAYIFLGQKDGLQMSTQDEMKSFLSNHFANCVFEDSLESDHDIIGVEQLLSERVVQWILAVTQKSMVI